MFYKINSELYENKLFSCVGLINRFKHRTTYVNLLFKMVEKYLISHVFMGVGYWRMTYVTYSP